MIDWISLVLNGLWIVGLAYLLATVSYHYWLAPLEGRSLRQQLDQPSFLQHFWLSFVFICAGLAGTSTRWWETIIWIGFLLYSMANAYMILHTGRK